MFHHKSFSPRSFSPRSWRFSRLAAIDLPPVFRHRGPLRITPAQRRKIHATAAVAWGFTVSASARVRLGASATGCVPMAAQAAGGMTLSGAASGSVEFSQNATADAVDVVLEAILLTS